VSAALRAMSTPLQYVWRLALPLGAAVAALVLARGFIAPGVDLDGMARGVAGPGSWPKLMLYGAAACLVAVFVRNLLEVRRAASSRAAADTPAYNDAKLLGGMALLVVYGAGITVAGIAWATLVFLAGWLTLSGLRRPLPVVLVSVLGTVGILYLFVKLCLMPLDRGKGIFEEATIVLYRLLGIY
jgi:putative tricarboxylic transport membrane protein